MWVALSGEVSSTGSFQKINNGTATFEFSPKFKDACAENVHKRNSAECHAHGHGRNDTRVQLVYRFSAKRNTEAEANALKPTSEFTYEAHSRLIRRPNTLYMFDPEEIQEGMLAPGSPSGGTELVLYGNFSAGNKSSEDAIHQKHTAE